MALQDTDNLIVQRGSTINKVQIQNMSTIQDTDLLIVGRGSESYKITGQDFMDQVKPPDAYEPPSMTGATLSGTGPGFSGETYTTTLQDYETGNPEATLGMKARVNGTFNLVGETSPVTGVDNSNPNAVVLTLTDRKDLDNGLFQPGDTLTKTDKPWNSDYPWSTLVNSPDGYYTDAGPEKAFDGDRNTSCSAPASNSAPITIDFSQADFTVLVSFKVLTDSSLDSVATLTTAGGDSTPVSFNKNDGLTEILDVARRNEKVLSLEIAGSPTIGYIEVDGQELVDSGTVDQDGVKVLSIGYAPDNTMTVDGGAWSIGETAKNTVARAPELTPETDVITDFVQNPDEGYGTVRLNNMIAAGGSYQIFRNPDTQNQAWSNDARDLNFNYADAPINVKVGQTVAVNCASESAGLSINLILETSLGEVDLGSQSVAQRNKWNEVANGDNTSWTVTTDGALKTIVKPLGGGNGGIVKILIDGEKVLENTLVSGDTVLTFASAQDLVNFKPGDDVVQDSGGYQPKTSPIIGKGQATQIDVVDRASLDTGGLTPTGSAAELFSPSGSWGIPRWSGSRTGTMTIAWDGGLAPADEIRVQASHVDTFDATLYVVFTDGTQAFDTFTSRDSDVTIDCGGKTPASIYYDWRSQSNCSVVVYGVFINGNRVESTLNGEQDLFLTDDTDLVNFRVGDSGITAIGPGDKITVADGSGYNVGDFVTGPVTEAGEGVFASTNGNTMSLSSVDETNNKRFIVGNGNYVIGPTGPATRVTSYLTWDNNNNVTGIVSSDPGYAPVTDLDLTFTDPAPTGQTWDQELPAGTMIETRVEATNVVDTADSGWSNTVTPRFQPVDADPDKAFAEAALRQKTFTNRKHVYCAQQVEAQRDQAIQSLAAEGYELSDILKYL